MFGYVRPLRGELKVKDWELYRACYCGLCYTLRQRYGLWACALVRYDAAVLAACLWQGDECVVEQRRCPVNPLVKRNSCAVTPSLERCADASVLLVYHKLRDEVRDSRWVKKWAAGLAAFAMRGAYRKAKRRLPEVEERLSAMTEELHSLEQQQCPSLDRTADTFASVVGLLPDAANADSAAQARLCYHIGRWIYLVDACDDVDKDHRHGNYNAVAARFELVDGQWTDAARIAMEETAGASLAAAAEAHAQLPPNRFSHIMRNVLYEGLPHTQRQILYGACDHCTSHQKRRNSRDKRSV